MRWPIRLQIFVPFALLLAAAVLGGAVWSSVLSARRTGLLETQQLQRVIDSLNAASFPYSTGVLDRMKGLSGAEFVAVDARGGLQASTLTNPQPLPAVRELPAFGSSATTLSDFPTHNLAGRTYFVSTVDAPGPAGPRRLYVLYPRDLWQRLQWDSAWPPLVVGGGSLILMLLVSGWLAHRIGRRVSTVQDFFTELEAGRFPRLEPTAKRDELDTLVESANHLSARLEALRSEVARTERLRTLAQLAAGFAHQLRNAITGARMGIQLHQRRCEQQPTDDALAVALAQLKLTEQQVQGLLSLTREPTSLSTPGDLATLVSEVEQLVGPQVRHLRIVFSVDCRLSRFCFVRSSDGLRGALLNLVLNAVEAAGVQGRVELVATNDDQTVQVLVGDSGPGPIDSAAGRLFEPFFTTKPEGAGLGLMLARQAAETEGGTLTWNRSDGKTHFLMQWPLPPP
ncbi:MAG: sensor histidine kinase [Planctomycetaceae bacterium]